MLSLIKYHKILGKGDQTAAILQELIEGTKALFESDHAAVKYSLDDQVLSKVTSEV